MNPDRNLLFGVVALHLETIDSKQFVEACSRWASYRDRPLADILVDLGMITNQQREQVDAKVAEFLAANDDDILKTIESLADATIQNTLWQVDDPQVHQTLSYLPAGEGYVHLDKLDLPVDTASRYTLTRVHSQGGVGTVWLARDEFLNRRIALKELRHDKVISEQTRRSFVKEAQITGQLEHPNIVPIHELARGPDDGEPFYTMRFLPGKTLKKEINLYHAARKQGDADPLHLRKLLDIFISICNAVAYSHSRGIVHRDLKPQNVMLGSFGEVIVIDWGMAKLIDTPDTEEYEPIDLTKHADTEATIKGRVMGTPAYMAPEQARGDNDLVDARTDIYGLGAVLFTILTGHHPHEGTTTRDLLNGIIDRPTPKVRDVNPQAHRALEAVCSKAMEKAQDDRYQSALALADDVQRWLADESVSVYREPLTVTVARWMRRNRTWTQAIAASLLVITAVATLAATIVTRAYRDEQRALASATEAKQVAARNLDLALQATDTWLVSAGELMQFYPGMEEPRSTLLEVAASTYASIAESKSDDPLLTAQSGRTWIRHGDVFRELGQPTEAAASYAKAESVFRGLTIDGHDNAQTRLDLATTLYRLGQVHVELGEFDEAAPHFENALGWISDFEQNEHEFLRIRLLEAQGGLFEEQLEFAKSRKMLEDAEAACNELLKNADKDRLVRYLTRLADIRSHLGQLMNKMGDGAAAIEKLRSGIDLHTMLDQESVDNPTLLSKLQIDRIRLAGIALMQGQPELALDSYDSAITFYDLLLEARPGVPRYLHNRAIARLGRANLLNRLGANDLARSEMETALSTIDRLLQVAGTRDVAETWQKALVIRARISADLNESDPSARAILDNVIAQYEIAVGNGNEPGKGNRALEIELATCLIDRGRLLENLGHYEPALRDFDAAIAMFESALKASADGNVHAEEALAWAYQLRADLKWRQGDETAAHKDYAQALTLLKALPPEPEYSYHLGYLLADCPDPTIRNADSALQTATDLSAARSGNAKYAILMALANYRGGKWEACVTAASEANRRLAELASGRDDLADALDASESHFLQAMALKKLEKSDQARQALTAAVDSMDRRRPGNARLLKLRGEAEQVLGASD